MSEKINNKMRSFLASTLIQSLKNQNPSSWRTAVYYPTGTQVVSDGKIFVSVSTGTSSEIAPTHSVGIALDGTVQWLYLGAAIGSSDIASNLYIGLGKPSQWNVGDTPLPAETTTKAEDEALDDLITLIRLNTTHVRTGLKKVAWVENTVYSQFDPNIEQSEYGNTIPSQYVVVGTDVYKCIDNNGGADSTDEPSGHQMGLVLMSDGYIWKYMGSVESTDQVAFSTDDFIPVSQKFVNDSSDQWDVQQQAKDGSISTFGDFISVGTFESAPLVTVVGDGTNATAGVEYNTPGVDEYDLTRIYATTGGQDYTQETYAIVQNSTATQGSGAEVTLNVVAGGVSVDDLVGGSGYSEGAVLVIIGDGTGATGTLTLSSGAVTVVNITDAGEDYTWAKAFIIPGGAGAVAKAIMAPVGGHGKDIVSELGAKTVIVSIQIAEALEPYVVDGEYRQISLIGSAQPTINGKINAASYIGPQHPDYALNPDSLDKYQKGSGHLLYLNNIEAITHSSEQEEVIKIALTF